MRARPGVLMTCVALTGCGASDVVVEPPIGWYAVWNDEFEGAEGTLPDTERWAYDIGNGVDGWGNGQLEFDTNRPENVALDGAGNLVITARKESFGGKAYTSARIKTQGLYATQYGRIEARIQLPVGRGVWPAFWMLGADIPEVGWPQSGEIDIMEYRGQEPSTVHGTLHGPGYSGGSPITRRFRLPDGVTFDEDFHVFAVEWDPSRISFWVDDEAYQIVTSSQVQAKGSWVYDHPFFILLNVAVGGGFVGAPDDGTPFPQAMRVDYVRVYSRTRP
ncbi:MAG: glycoside hydrolase family 16 protein [Myxococcales bacterium]|nr:glycoside hydrolase family 16 protein [Myxococcales bacterium]